MAATTRLCTSVLAQSMFEATFCVVAPTVWSTTSAVKIW
jgi:hypothetical protein